MAQLDLTREDVEEAAATLARWWIRSHWEGGNLPPIPGILTAPEEPEDEGPLLTRSEAAKLLRVSPTQITRMRRRKQIAPVKRLLPGKVRYRKRDLEKFIDRNR